MHCSCTVAINTNSCFFSEMKLSDDVLLTPYNLICVVKPDAAFRL